MDRRHGEARLQVLEGGQANSSEPGLSLVERAAAGDSRAWAELYEAHFDALLRYVAYSVGDVGTAEELVQEAFALALVGLDGYDGRASFAAWMRGISTNLIRKHWRKRQRQRRAYTRLEQAHAVSAPDEDLDRNMIRDRRAQALLHGLETLPENLREAFVLSDVHGMSATEASEALGISPGNVRVRAARARARLRDRFETLGLLTNKEDRR